MPLVKVKWDSENPNLTLGHVREVVNALPGIIAKALDVPDSKHVKVSADKLDELSVNFRPLDITIFAQKNPTRLANLGKAKMKVIDAVKPYLKIEGYVRIILIDGSFGPFKGTREEVG